MKKKLFSKNLLSKSMNKYRSARKIGLTPGSLVYTGEKKIATTTIIVTDFNAEKVDRREIAVFTELPEQRESKRWLHIQGLHDTELLQMVGDAFSIHSLVLEDVVNLHQSPKIEEFEDYLFIITKMLTYDEENGELKSEHISFILLDNLIISFQETDAAYFDPIMRRLENPKGRMRKYSADYFLYTLLDLVVDHYFIVIDALADQFERLERNVISNPTRYHVEEIHHLKRQVITFRKLVRPLRDVTNILLSGDVNLISDDTNVFLRDLYDHTIQVIDSLETQRELVSGLLDTYLSQVSHRMNEVMKVLTIMSTIFIPLGFLAGLYGMNFVYMPELNYKYGYFSLLGVMLLIVIGMILFFRHKKWL